MKELNIKTIRKESKLNSTLINSIIFTIAGIILSIMPLLYLKTIDSNSIIGLVTCTVCFGIPFGVVLGLMKFIPSYYKHKSLKNNTYIIDTDVVVRARMMREGIESDNSDHYCQVELQNYSKATGKYYTISRRLFNKIEKGDTFYVIYTEDKRYVVGIFACKKYALDKELEKHLI